MKFDFAIGNPPYQEKAIGANAKDPSIYHHFYDAAFSIADKVELITPARFLFNAGDTPKEWNEKMLEDKHLKVKMYEQKSSDVFSGTSITGGVTVIYRDLLKDFGPIGFFSPFKELNTIAEKVSRESNQSICDIVYNRGLYRYSDLAYEEQPILMKQTADRRIAPSAFERMPKLFTEEKPINNYEYVKVYGRDKVFRWFRKDYVKEVDNLNKYKVLISKADGAAGQIGNPIPARICGKPFIAEPSAVSTETFIAIGSLDCEEEASAIAKYIKTRFARTMLGVLKVTQNYAKPTWEKIPMQDFTSQSDIDWSKSIPEIDKQLYDKYGLSSEERDFIETHVKEME